MNACPYCDSPIVKTHRCQAVPKGRPDYAATALRGIALCRQALADAHPKHVQTPLIQVKSP